MSNLDYYTIPNINGGESYFPKITSVKEILDDNKKCRFCLRRHLKEIPGKCKGKYSIECRNAFYNDLKIDMENDDSEKDDF